MQVILEYASFFCWFLCVCVYASVVVLSVCCGQTGICQCCFYRSVVGVRGYAIVIFTIVLQAYKAMPLLLCLLVWVLQGYASVILVCCKQYQDMQYVLFTCYYFDGEGIDLPLCLQWEITALVPPFSPFGCWLLQKVLPTAKGLAAFLSFFLWACCYVLSLTINLLHPMCMQPPAL